MAWRRNMAAREGAHILAGASAGRRAATAGSRRTTPSERAQGVKVTPPPITRSDTRCPHANGACAGTTARHVCPVGLATPCVDGWFGYPVPWLVMLGVGAKHAVNSSQSFMFYSAQ